MISSTLALVFLTTIVFGALMPMAIKFFKSFDPIDSPRKSKAHLHALEEDKAGDNVNFKYDFSHPNFHKE